MTGAQDALELRRAAARVRKRRQRERDAAGLFASRPVALSGPQIERLIDLGLLDQNQFEDPAALTRAVESYLALSLRGELKSVAK